jgi:hypothetical protein
MAMLVGWGLVAEKNVEGDKKIRFCALTPDGELVF